MLIQSEYGKIADDAIKRQKKLAGNSNFHLDWEETIKMRGLLVSLLQILAENGMIHDGKL